MPERKGHTAEVIIQFTKQEIQELAQKQFGRPLTDEELMAFDDLSPIGLHDWIGLAIEAAMAEPEAE